MGRFVPSTIDASLLFERCTEHMSLFCRARHFVLMGTHLVYMGAQCRPNGRPWAQNVWLCYYVPAPFHLHHCHRHRPTAEGQ